MQGAIWSSIALLAGVGHGGPMLAADAATWSVLLLGDRVLPAGGQVGVFEARPICWECSSPRLNRDGPLVAAILVTVGAQLLDD